VSSHQQPQDRRAAGWFAALVRPFVGIGVGALAAAAYGVFVALVHFVVSGRWANGPAFAFWVTIVGAIFGLVVGIVSVLWSSASPSTAEPGDVAPADPSDRKDTAA
jgi:hypothetical protein